MKKKLVIALIMLVFVAVTYAANVAWTDKAELTAINNADILLVVDDVSGTATSKKITVLNFFDTIDTFSELDTIVADKTLVNEEDWAGSTNLTTLGTIATGTWQATDVGVAYGGTGASTLTDGFVLLGSGTAAITPLDVTTDGAIVIGDGTTDPTTLDVGSSTSITILGTIATGVWQGTDVGVQYGGTGASSLTDGGILLGSGTSAITALGVATNGQIPIGDGATDPVLATISGGTSITVTNGAGTISVAVDDDFIKNSTSDTMAGTLTADGLTLGANENITLGSQTLDHDGTDFVFNDSVNIGGNALTTTVNIKGQPRHLIFNVFNPLGVQTDDTQVCIWPVTPAALTVTKIVVTLDAAGNEVAGDLKWADTFIGLANATVINTFDTSSGVTSDDSITAGTVAAGKAMYIQFDSAPHTDITQMSVDITWDYD